MRATAPARLAWAGALSGLLLALLLFAPARWLAQALTRASEGRVQLINASGTVWNGQADLLLTGGEGSRSKAALPQGLRWQLRPGWADGGPAAHLRLKAPCCTPQPLHLTALPGLQGVRLQLAALQTQWPAEVLTGLGTPWNTLRLEGRLQIASPGLDLQLGTARRPPSGALTLEVHDLASRLSTLRPLGSYRLTLTAGTSGDGVAVALQTLSGELQLLGQGQWLAGRLRFRGEAQAAPGREAALANLLNIIGRRQGTRSLLNIG